ncbi:MAG: hypothetical protein H7282_16820, partial [Cytophagaceae bacterium]|nr:hypothetical protein [Cytophagaceae bacterium]
MKHFFLIALISFITLPIYASQEECIAFHTSTYLTQMPMNFFQQFFAPKDKRTLAEIVGPLKRNPDYKGWYESAPVNIPYLGQKIKITFTQGEDSSFMAGAEVVLKQFLQLNEANRLNDSKLVERNYQDGVSSSGAEPLNIKSAQDVWNFVRPTDIFIEKNTNGKYYLAISCTCEWEKTHGLQLVFREGKKLTRASGHDGQY